MPNQQKSIPLRDIDSREDLRCTMVKFYDLLLSDDLICHFFDGVVEEGLDAHLDILVDFWENMLFYTGGYQRNAMRPHLILHRQMPMEKLHFEAWISHLKAAVESLYSGPKAEEMLRKAQQIATLMEMKVTALSASGGFS